MAKSILTLDQFKTKWLADINRGIVDIVGEDDIYIDRYIGGEWLCESNYLLKIQTDVRKMGYRNVGLSHYTKTEYTPIGTLLNDFSDKIKSDEHMKIAIALREYGDENAYLWVQIQIPNFPSLDELEELKK